MKLNFLLILIFLIPFQAKSDQIFELIKIQNLKILYNDNKGIKYLIANKNFSAGVGINSVNCEKSKMDKLNDKFLLTKKNITQTTICIIYIYIHILITHYYEAVLSLEHFHANYFVTFY